jgi:predicted permease
MRHFIADAALLGLTSLAVGWTSAYLSVRALTGLLPPEYGGAAAPDPGTPGMVLIVLLSALTAALSMMPALALSARKQSAQVISLRDGSRSGSRTAGRRWLIVVEVGVATILLAGTIAMTRSLVALQNTDLGFDPDGALAFSMSMPMADMRKVAQRAAAFDPVLARIRAIPGVAAAGATTALPLSQSDLIGLLFAIEGVPETRAFRDRFAWTIGVTPGYFEAAGMRLLAGRQFDARDLRTSAPVAIVNRTLASRYGTPAEMLGKRMTLPGDPPITIVGVIDDVRHRDVSREPGPQAYRPHTQLALVLNTVAVRPSDRRLELAPDIRSIVAGVDPDLIVYDVAPIGDFVRASTGRQRLLSALFTIFAAIAVLLSGIAAYAMVTQYVTESRRDIGVRRALGAGGWDIVTLVLRHGVVPAVCGAAIGTACTVALLRLGSASTLGLNAPGVGDQAIAMTVLVALAIVACAVPAAAAARLDPSRLLREG